ncbi:MAG TPA: glycosyltransferase family 39 protein [Terriglobales bacterium]|nr:glycosyltransferase family 39 protein [Terriglobales bacterium]
MSKSLQQHLPEAQGEFLTHNAGASVLGPRVSSGSILGALVVITALGAWLRLQELGTFNLWLDEAYSVFFAHMPAGEFWKLMWSREGNMLLYYVFLRSWVHLGDTEFMLRLSSVQFAVFSIPIIYLLGRDLFGRMEGLIAAALLSVHMFHVFLSRQARSYSLLVLLLLLSCWLFLKFTQTAQSRFYLAAYAIVSVLAVYAHLFAFLVIVSQWLLLLGTRGRRVGRQRIAAAIALVLVLALPMEAFALLKSKGQLDWVPALTTSTFLDGVHALAGYGNKWLSGLYAALAIAAMALGARDDHRGFALRVVESWLWFPVLAMLLYSVHKPVFYSRFLIICVPALILLASYGLVAMVRRRRRLLWISAAVFLLALGMSLLATRRYLRTRTCADWKPATALVVATARATDAICFAGTGAEVFLYYMQREKHMPWSALPKPYYSRGARCFSNSPEDVAKADSPYHGAWLIKTDASPEQHRWISELLTSRFGSARPEGSFACPAGKITIELLP